MKLANTTKEERKLFRALKMLGVFILENQEVNIAKKYEMLKIAQSALRQKKYLAK